MHVDALGSLICATCRNFADETGQIFDARQHIAVDIKQFRHFLWRPRHLAHQRDVQTLGHQSAHKLATHDGIIERTINLHRQLPREL
ncbi:MAG: hypothetical protein EBV58_07835 [Actinobacteria bacterium]|nr:hypothetical protein [Actinomycetota bacterium]